MVGGILWTLHPWVIEGELSPRLVGIALLSLVVNLLAAGGIGFPGVAQTLWLLGAVGLNSLGVPAASQTGLAGEGRRESPVHRRDRWGWIVGIVLLSGLAFAMYLQSYRPVTQARVLLQRAGESRNYQQLEGWYAQAATKDPLDPVPWQLLAELAQLRWLEVDQTIYRQRFEQCLVEARRRNSQSAAFADYSGRLHLRAYRSAGRRADLTDALEAFRRALELYPNHGMGHAQLAWVAHLAGESEEARQHADLALQLDSLNPHWEQQLAQRTIQDPGPGVEVGEQPSAPPAGQSAEQVMKQLRSGEWTGQAGAPAPADNSPVGSGETFPENPSIMVE
jgi:hypothetical protein